MKKGVKTTMLGGNWSGTCHLTLSIEQTTHYYPYGGILTYSTNQGVQKYKYNGKELDRMHGLDWYDYNARQYDPAMGEFTSIDPSCEKYYNISPYAYCAGNPIRYVDPTGRDYSLHFDHDKRIITIFANYQVQSDAQDVFDRAKKFWNDLIFKIKDYTVIFNITDIADQDGHFMNTFSLSSHQTNENENVNENVNVLGVTDHGNKILLYENSTKESAIHEIGHTLGLKHYPDDNDNIMYYNSY